MNIHLGKRRCGLILRSDEFLTRSVSSSVAIVFFFALDRNVSTLRAERPAIFLPYDAVKFNRRSYNSTQRENRATCSCVSFVTYGLCYSRIDMLHKYDGEIPVKLINRLS